MDARESELREKVKMLLGKPPYDHPCNICWNDNYFAKALNNEFGEIAVSLEIKRQTKGTAT